MDNQINRRPAGNSGVVVGALLVLAGLVFLGAQFLPSDSAHAWPLLVVVAGVALLSVGVTVRSAAGLVVPGSIITVTGVVLAVQNTFGLWATWSYAWALVAPGSVGLGIALLGLLHRDGARLRDGLRTATVGLVLFAVFGAFFEGVIRISGFAFGPSWNLVLALLLIGAGAAILIARLIWPRSESGPRTPVQS